jgi:hypothetical protein
MLFWFFHYSLIRMGWSALDAETRVQLNNLGHRAVFGCVVIGLGLVESLPRFGDSFGTIFLTRDRIDELATVVEFAADPNAAGMHGFFGGSDVPCWDPWTLG